MGSALDEFRAGFDGEGLLPGDDGYDWGSSKDRQSSRCHGPGADLAFARSNQRHYGGTPWTCT